MKFNITQSAHPRDRLEIAHCTAAGVQIRDRRETRWLPFGRNQKSEVGSLKSDLRPLTSDRFPDRQFPEARRGHALTISVLPENFQLK